MNLNDFRQSIESDDTPPAGFEPALEAMWFAGKGNWNRAHEIVQGHEGTSDPDWVHAYLHRVEGDIANAGYWYARCGKPRHEGPLEEEWAAIVTSLLGRG